MMLVVHVCCVILLKAAFVLVLSLLAFMWFILLLMVWIMNGDGYGDGDGDCSDHVVEGFSMPGSAKTSVWTCEGDDTKSEEEVVVSAAASTAFAETAETE